MSSPKQFDVFLCHNSQDKTEVIEIANQLREQGIVPWLDKWELRPGFSWQELLEEQIANIKSAAVFVGSSGLGPWQKRELRAFLNEFTERDCPIIPVLLPNAPEKPQLPIFLKGMTWVDGRKADAVDHLIWGITGVKPSSNPREPQPQKPPQVKLSSPFTSSVTVKGLEVEREKVSPKVISENLGKDVTLEMIALSGGTFQMGSNEDDSEKPIHPVTVQPFYLGKYPITQEQYQAVMGTNPSGFKGAKRPVEKVSWNDAVEFCKKLSQKTGKNYRLPSEAEWEYACRAGTQTKYCFGDDEKQLEKYAWYSGNSNSETHPVGQKNPNQFGLYDMHGNVWEWCDDDWHENYQGAPMDGRAWVGNNDNRSQSSKVLRGSSWNLGARYCRSGLRLRNLAEDVYDLYGFRVACLSFLPRTL